MAFRLRPRSIHGELALLVGVLLLPLIALTAYLLYAQAQRDLHDAEAVVRRLAQSHAERAERFVADTRAVLQTLAWRPLVRAMNAARCDPGLRELLDLYPRAANSLVVDRAGRILCGAIPPPRGQVSRIADEALLGDILATGNFAISRPFIGTISKMEQIENALRMRAAGQEHLPIPVSGPREIAAMARELDRDFERRARSKQLFAALSEVYEVVVRVRERDELFRQVCRICVERMRFLVASVALVDAAQQRIVPHVYAGPGAAILRDIVFPLDPSAPLATTVTSTAVRTKRAAVANDVDADPSKAVARPIRERIGSRSTASFPLFRGGEVLGALTVHSEARDFCDAAMVELLTRTARRIVHRHGHRNWAAGELGKGAAFTFTITQAEGAHEGSAHTAG